MNSDITLLIFRLHKHNSHDCDLSWLPDGCSALALSGGVTNFWERREGWNWGIGTSPSESPFLHDAPPWLLKEVVWSLLGENGRLYVTFEDDARAAQAYGLKPVGHGMVRYKLRFTGVSEPYSDWMWPTFFMVGSSGVAAGYADQVTHFEKELLSLPIALPVNISGKLPAPYQVFFDLMQGSIKNLPAQLLIYPWGYEDMDGLLVVDQLSHDTIVSRIRDVLRDRVNVLEFDGNVIYENWASSGVLPGIA